MDSGFGNNPDGNGNLHERWLPYSNLSPYPEEIREREQTAGTFSAAC
jgi:hypothetical protein